MITLRAALAALLLLATPAVSHDGIHIEDAYARASARSGAVFLRLVNHAATADRLIGARTDAADRAELHTHTEDANGVMQMLHVTDGFEVAATSERTLARGGDHVMLMGLTRALATGDTITLTLIFQTGGEVTLQVPVDNDRKDTAGHTH